MSIRTLARLGALPAATAAVALSLAAPASAHVTATPSTAAAGAFTVVTFSVGHGCEGSPTTRIEIQVPESVLSVTPSRNPFYDVEKTIQELDEPVTDAHGNEVTERTGSIVYTATTPLPDGQRDAFEVSFQVPDAEGETLSFPTIQTCQEGETDWTEVPADGQDAEELETPAPAFVITAAEGDGHGDDAAAEPASDEGELVSASAESSADAADDAEDGSSALGWAGLVAGLLGLAAGGLALARTRSSS
ncbi:MAG TPA: YcnI family protein [Nocardioides sp.]|nr:YcnI family protein [Nocardioides sp.]